MKEELQRRQSNTDKVEALFRSRPGEWIDAHELQRVGGSFAFRTRISDCRRKRSMFIENKEQRSARNEVIGSWYRYLEHAPIGPDAATRRSEKHPAVQIPLLETHPR